MNKTQREKMRLDISRKLKSFGKTLLDGGLIRDVKKFDEAANNCLSTIPIVKGIDVNYANSWGYEISDLQILFSPEDIDAEIFPEKSNITSISITSKVIGKFLREDYAEDPLIHVEFNLVVKGVSNEGVPLIASWHLDRHPDNSKSKSVHPVYHFQYGGHKLVVPNNNFGSQFVLDMPRIMHPPLEIILGVDFVLSNFFGEKRELLCCDNRPYVLSVSKLQDLIWRPYVYSVARHWQPYGNEDSRFSWNCIEIYPQLLKSN